MSKTMVHVLPVEQWCDTGPPATEINMPTSKPPSVFYQILSIHALCTNRPSVCGVAKDREKEKSR